MNELLKILLSLSISGTLLFLVLALSKRLFKNKISKIWQYYIWLIVVARFLLPFTPEINLVGNIFQQIENVIPQSKMKVNTENDVIDLTTYSDGDNPAVNQGKNPKHPKTSNGYADNAKCS